jgi:hypothetical protein
MTIRLGGRAYDSFVPAPIRERAKWTIEESDQRGSAGGMAPILRAGRQDEYSPSTAIPVGKPPAEPSSGHARSCEPTSKVAARPLEVSARSAAALETSAGSMAGRAHRDAATARAGGRHG